MVPNPVSAVAQEAVVVGAGPAGLLAAILLKQLNWKVTVIERDSSLVDNQGFDKNRMKSWVIGLNQFGRAAVQTVPGLWENEVEKLTMEITKANFWLFGKWRDGGSFNSGSQKQFVVDRNAFVAALTRHLLTNYPDVQFYFESTVRYIDGKRQMVAVTSNQDPEGDLIQIPYDLLVGADGARSVVRNSLFSQNPLFECSQSAIFQSLKTAYIRVPAGFNQQHGYFSAMQIPGAVFMLFPAPGQYMNMLIVVKDNSAVDDELLSTDPQVFCQYINRIVDPAIQLTLTDCEQLVAAGWHRSQQVTCSPYHLDAGRGSAVLIGDAAHATHPALGMGMNMGLEDAKHLYHLLLKSENDISSVLSQFSEDRMKIGRALTDLSFNLMPVDSSRIMTSELRQLGRRILSKLSGGYFNLPVREMIAKGVPLDEMYRQAMNQHTFVSTRRQNVESVREFNDQKVGLLPQTDEFKKAIEQRKLMHATDVRRLRGVQEDEYDQNASR